MTKSCVVHICVAPSDSYVPHCAAMLSSVSVVHRCDDVHVHLLYSGNWDSELEVLANYVARLGMHFHQVDVPNELIQSLPATRYPATVWFSMLAASLIKQSRVIYLDCDLIVRRNLSEIYEIELGSYWLAAVHDSAVVWPGQDKDAAHVRSLGLENVEQYLNSGVLVMNLDAMRQRRIQDELLAYAMHPESANTLADQDAINAVARGGWVRLSMAWNVRQVLLQREKFVADIPGDELREARFRPAIVHFTGPGKPWVSAGFHPFRHEYIRHRLTTPWGAEGLPKIALWERFYSVLPVAIRVFLFPVIVRMRATYRARVRRLLRESPDD